MQEPPDLWPVDSPWFAQLPLDLGLVFIHAEELLCCWRGISSQAPFDACSDLADAFLIAPEIIEVLNQELREFGNEFSAAATLPVAYEDIVAPNTPSLVIQCAHRFFVDVYNAFGDGRHEKAGNAADLRHAVREFILRANMETLSYSPLSSPDFQRLRSMLEQELCRASRHRVPTAAPVQTREEAGTPAVAIPNWNRARSTLNFGKEVSKYIRRLGNATNVVRILDALQELGWPERIDDPLPNGPDGQRLHETIRSLNTGLKFIRFRADGTGEGLIWELAAQPPGDSQLPPG